MRSKIRFPKLARSHTLEVMGFRLQKEDVTTIFVEGVIGDEWDGLTASTLVPQILVTEGDIVLRLNTPGGSVFDAVDVYSALVEHSGNVRADIVGQAWSAGTILAAAADTIRIAEVGVWGTHRAWTIAMGNAAEFRAMAEDLDVIDNQLDKLIADRSGLSLERVKELSIGKDGSDGTQFVGQAAIDIGFADELIPNKRKSSQKNDAKLQAERNAVRLMRQRLRLTGVGEKV